MCIKICHFSAPIVVFIVIGNVVILRTSFEKLLFGKVYCRYKLRNGTARGNSDNLNNIS